MTQMADFDVVGVGLNAVDTVFGVPHFPACGGKAPFRDERLSPGGQVASAMVACASLGLRTKYIGSVGDDERGRIQTESLRLAGVNVESMQLRKGCATQSAYIVIDSASGERTVFWRRDDCLRIEPAEITYGDIACGRLLHIDGHDIEAVGHAARIARSAEVPVTVDVDTIYPGFDQVLPHVDYLIGSSEFPLQWTKQNDPFQALETIQREYKMRVAAMTLGADGALALEDGRFIYSPGFMVDCVDTTGAGDVFHGAFCYAVLQRMSMREALDFSNAMAALNCRAFGARGGISGLTEIKSLITRGERRSRGEFETRATGARS